ncbi:MAG TPA: hypothetical protein VHO01_14835, partial [Jatrophihabitans sp.]|nr:hypothetical protein [Jatrophihabitans sp.]
MKNRLLVPAVIASLAGSLLAIAATASTAQAAPAAQLGRPAARQAHVARTPARLVRPTHSGQPQSAVASPKLATSLQALAASPIGSTAHASGIPLAKDGTVSVTVNGADVTAAARAVGAKLSTRYRDQADLRIKPAALAALAAQPGISRVATTKFALPQAAVSEGVAASGASAWQAAAPQLGNGGAGVNIAIVDAGFLNLQNEISNGNLPAANVVYNRQPPASSSTPDTDPANMDHCLGTNTYDVNGDENTDHGTAVAEIVHQMVPNATLYLYCIQSSTQFNQAAGQIIANSNTVSGKIKIASSSLGFLGEARGDGFGGPDTTEGAV